MTNQTRLCRAIAEVAHAGQSYGDKSYFTGHVEEVARHVKGKKGAVYLHLQVAYLHDVIEDTTVHAGHLLDMGVDKETVDTVAVLTRRSDETYANYIERVAQNPVARFVKIADIEVNLGNLNENQGDSTLRERYTRALKRLKEFESR